MILIDANVFMYAAGAPHPCKQPSVRFLTLVAEGKIDAATNAEVLQEILHRYRAIHRWEQGRSVYDLARELCPRVLPVDAAVMDRARALMDRQPALIARDAVHAAVFDLVDARALCSYDRDFDSIPGMRRSPPQDFL
jgi:hypothetical protein